MVGNTQPFWGGLPGKDGNLAERAKMNSEPSRSNPKNRPASRNIYELDEAQKKLFDRAKSNIFLPCFLPSSFATKGVF